MGHAFATLEEATKKLEDDMSDDFRPRRPVLVRGLRDESRQLLETNDDENVHMEIVEIKERESMSIDSQPLLNSSFSRNPFKVLSVDNSSVF